MSKFISLLAALSLFIAPMAQALGRETCSDAIFRSILVGGAENTAWTTTAVTAVWADALQEEVYDPAGRWARSSDVNVAEWCWTGPNTSATGDFWIRSYLWGRGGAVSALYDTPIGAALDNSVDAADIVEDQMFTYYDVAADEFHLRRQAFTEVTSGGCIALMMDADGATGGAEEAFFVDVQQLDTAASPCNRH